MPVFLLKLKANLENVSRLEFSSDYLYHVTLKNPESEDTRDVVISTEDQIPLSSGRATAHFVMKWDKSSKMEASINVTEVKGITRSLTAEDNETFVAIIGFECRGVEPIAFHPTSGFIIESTSGKIWEDTDLTEGDWCEFDEGLGESVGVYEMESTFDLLKK